jgi:hypothetical protein
VFLSTLISHALAVALMVAAAGAVDQPDQFLSGAAAALHADGGTFRRGRGLDRGQPARLPAGYGAGAQRDSDVLVLGHADLHRGSEVSPQARFLLRANPLYYAVRSYRTILLHSTMPRFEDLAVSAAFGIGVFVVGGFSSAT